MSRGVLERVFQLRGSFDIRKYERMEGIRYTTKVRAIAVRGFWYGEHKNKGNMSNQVEYD